MKYPHLIDCTMSDDDIRCYIAGIGVTEDMLTEEEKSVLATSRAYQKEKLRKRNKTLLELAREDFERLRDIPGMPEEAIAILKEWTTRDGDEEDEDDY